jgi:hypothetical protein
VRQRWAKIGQPYTPLRLFDVIVVRLASKAEFNGE